MTHSLVSQSSPRIREHAKHRLSRRRCHIYQHSMGITRNCKMAPYLGHLAQSPSMAGVFGTETKTTRVGYPSQEQNPLNMRSWCTPLLALLMSLGQCRFATVTHVGRAYRLLAYIKAFTAPSTSPSGAGSMILVPTNRPEPLGNYDSYHFRNYS